MRNKIFEHLNQYDLDVRKTHDARFSDQKCTPDVVCFIADCIINTVYENDAFNVSDIWNSQYFIKNTRAIFNKPWANDERARHEYDKFIAQPLRLLASAHVLEIDYSGPRYMYRVRNAYILDYIAQRERNTFTFLCCYFEKVLTDSGFWKYFLEYKENPNKDSYMELRDRFIKFMIGNTAINTAVEVRRIFPKILNVLAVDNQIPGSERGHISEYVYTFSDLMYNRKNWRDLNKEKTMTRQEAIEDEADTQQQEAYNAYYVQKAIAQIRKIHTESEVHDQWGQGEATQVHHIFPKSQFPQIAHYLENLILLTATQHYTKAHPSNRTQEVNKDYQLVCLLAKADTIDKSLRKFGERYYRKESFLFVIKTGLQQEQEWSMSLSFNDIKLQLIQVYNSVGIRVDKKTIVKDNK